ncbi:MAG: DUF5693 family protein [Synergistaceae bacterium]|jgi:hypothetical protein|nr:DUF5693 family protein [Synergistaceae bacterium]
MAKVFDDAGKTFNDAGENAAKRRGRSEDRGGLGRHSADRRRAAGEPRHALCSAEKFFWAMLLIATLLSSRDIMRRLGIEWRHRTVAVIVEYRDVVLLSRQAGESPEITYAKMRERGAVGITAAELTGKDLASGMLPLTYGSLASLPYFARSGLNEPLDHAALLVDNADPNLQNIVDFLRLRMKGLVINPSVSNTLIVLPNSPDELADAGVLPDFGALSFAEREGIVSLYRPAPSPGVSGTVASDTIRWLDGRYPAISGVVPAGQIIVGFPDVAPFAQALKELDIPVAQAEFIRQIGISELLSLVRPSILPLHSLVRDELISRRMTRNQIIERMVRAVHERSIRILLLRPYELYSVGKLDPFLDDLRSIKDSLNRKGYAVGWPEAIPMFGSSLPAAVGLAAVFLVTLWSYALRYSGALEFEVTFGGAVVMCLSSLALGFAAWKIYMVSRPLGGFCSALVATEAALWAMDRYEKLFAGMIAGLLIVLAGGLSIAAFYGTTDAMLRLAPFSGVKLTLLLPPLLLMAYDLKGRIHPESLAEIVSRPPLWGELALMALMLLGAAVMTVRSGNVSFVPGWEARFRDILERVMWIRPRTKEFLVGYPCLFIYYAFKNRGWAPNYREVLRIGASLAYSSAINTFTHFHTLLPLTVVRVVNGWWLGVVVGLAVLVLIDYLCVPIWRMGGRELFD